MGAKHKLAYSYYIHGGDTLQKKNQKKKSGCFNPARVISVAASESILNHMLDQYIAS